MAIICSCDSCKLNDCNDFFEGENIDFLSILWDLGQDAVSWREPPRCIEKVLSLYFMFEIEPVAATTLSSVVIANEEDVGRRLSRVARFPEFKCNSKVF